jgi:hypothetical protein
MQIIAENILKVIDVPSKYVAREFIKWLDECVSETYKDQVLKEHLYNPDDFDEMEEVPGRHAGTIAQLQQLCRENEAGISES